MLNRKIIILVLILAIAMAVSGCIKKTEKPVVNNGNDQKINQEQKKEYEGKLIKEENGWKRYRNEYWGVEFRFRDEEDEIINNDMRDGVIIRHKEKGPHINPYIYISFYKDNFRFDQKQQANLKEYLEAGGWNIYQESAELISIKDITNNNGLTFIEVVANVSGGRQSSGYSKHGVCYIEYNKNNKNIIKIRNIHADIADDIINSFKFID